MLYALPVRGQDAPVLSGISWGNDECIVRGFDQKHAYHFCYYGGAHVEFHPEGHFHLTRRSQRFFELETLHGQLSDDDALAEVMFSKFVKTARSCEADPSCDLPQEVSTFLGSEDKCQGRIASYDLYDFFEHGDTYIKIRSAGPLTVCTAEKGVLWVYQRYGVLTNPKSGNGLIAEMLGGDRMFTYVYDEE